MIQSNKQSFVYLFISLLYVIHLSFILYEQMNSFIRI